MFSRLDPPHSDEKKGYSPEEDDEARVLAVSESEYGSQGATGFAGRRLAEALAKERSEASIPLVTVPDESRLFGFQQSEDNPLRLMKRDGPFSKRSVGRTGSIKSPRSTDKRRGEYGKRIRAGERPVIDWNQSQLKEIVEQKRPTKFNQSGDPRYFKEEEIDYVINMVRYRQREF